VSKQKLTTRIIGGKYKGKVLALPRLDITRSSKSILKESFFNVLQFDIINTIFIEVFGGSGSIGLEALSRGTKKSYFCEINKQSYKVLCQNCNHIQKDSCITIFGDSFEKIPVLINSLDNKKEQLIIYIDPPFDFRDGMNDIYKKSYKMVKNITNDNIMLVAFEHNSSLNLPDTLGKFYKFKIRKFGKSSLSYYKILQN
jgi:16S rRNA (guanine(966)-N(2))-methyltransferase RsmD